MRPWMPLMLALLLAWPARAQEIDARLDALDAQLAQAEQQGRPADVAQACRDAELLLIRAGAAGAMLAERCADAQGQLGLGSDASLSLTIALEGHRRNANTERAVIVALRLADLYSEMGDTRRADAAERRALSLARSLEDPRLLGQALLARARAEADRRRPDLALETAQRAQRLFLGLEDAPGLALTFQVMGEALLVGQNMSLARTAFGRAQAHYRLAGDRLAEARMVQVIAATHLEEGAPQATETLLREAVAVLDDAGLTTPDAWRLRRALQTQRAQLLGAEGNVEAALAAWKQVHDAAAALGDRAGQVQVLNRMIALAREAGASHLLPSFQARRDTLTGTAPTTPAVDLAPAPLPWLPAPGSAGGGGQGILQLLPRE